MYLARVIGRVVATQRSPGLTGVPLQWIQPLDENGRAEGHSLVACSVVGTGPGDLVQFVDGREAALACPIAFVPVDATIIGFVERATVDGRSVGPKVADRSIGPAVADRSIGPAVADRSIGWEDA